MAGFFIVRVMELLSVFVGRGDMNEKVVAPPP
jgi:hypothetical protein